MRVYLFGARIAFGACAVLVRLGLLLCVRRLCRTGVGCVEQSMKSHIECELRMAHTFELMNICWVFESAHKSANKFENAYLSLRKVGRHGAHRGRLVLGAQVTRRGVGVNQTGEVVAHALFGRAVLVVVVLVVCAALAAVVAIVHGRRRGGG
jgi:hypothetical protein